MEGCPGVDRASGGKATGKRGTENRLAKGVVNRGEVFVIKGKHFI